MARGKGFVTSVASINGETVCKYCAAKPISEFSGGYHNNDYEEWYECTCDTAKEIYELNKIYNAGLNAKREIDRLHKVTAPEVVKYQFKASLNNVVLNYKSLHKIPKETLDSVFKELLD